MKQIFWIVLACISGTTAWAQHITSNQEVKVLTGSITESMLANDPAFPWFYQGVNHYQPNAAALAEIREKKDLFQIIAFVGTWDTVTMRILPAFYKSMIQIGYPLNQITMYGLDTQLQGADKLPKKYHIQSVPSFVILVGKTPLGTLSPPFQQPIEVALAQLLQPPAK
ncbi:MAG: hypothetical protein K6T34_02785 [Thermoflavifilum sp.]|nr:hypothetical protein [Thermoflavifilum sp.]